MKINIQVQDTDKWIEELSKQLEAKYKDDCKHNFDIVKQKISNNIFFNGIIGRVMCKNCNSVLDYKIKNNSLNLKQVVHGSGFLIYKQKSIPWLFISLSSLLLLIIINYIR